MRKSGLILDYPPTVRLLGKGRRERVCPLWPSTAVLLDRYVTEHRPRPLREAEPFVFINQRRGLLTRHGVRKIIKKHVARAAETLPSLRKKNLTPHSFRHSTAVHLLESGADINVLKAWLGHRSVKSTGRYLDLTLENHRQMLETLPLPARLRAWKEPGTSAAETTDAVKAWLEQL
jgi:site-specific recombinase XerD